MRRFNFLNEDKWSKMAASIIVQYFHGKEKRGNFPMDLLPWMKSEQCRRLQRSQTR